MPIKLLIIENIKKYRVIRGMTQEELSLRIGKRDDFITKLENKEILKDLSLELADQIAQVLNVKVRDLAEDEE